MSVAWIILCMSIVASALGDAFERPRAVAVIFMGTGAYDWGIFDVEMSHKWQAGLARKLADSNWPVNASLEMVDFHSNTTYMVAWAANRVKQEPPVSVFVFPTVGVTLMSKFYHFGVPCILSVYSANKYNDISDPGPGWNFTFFNLPPVQYYYKELTRLWKQVDVKSIVVFVDLSDADFSYNKQSCERAANDLMIPNGIEVLKTFEFHLINTPGSTVRAYVRETAKLNPDAVLACVTGSTSSSTMNIPWLGQIMKEENYIPKAMNVLDMDGTSGARKFIEEKTMIYMTQPTFGHHKLSGLDYTNGDTPYSNYFLDSPVLTVRDALLAGSNLDSEHRSSTQLFYEWFTQEFGFSPSYYNNIMWSVFDCIEAAFYHTAIMRRGMGVSGGSISAAEMQEALLSTKVPTPFGRVVYDIYRVNTAASAVLIQWHNISEDTEIVVPSTVATADFVYPMPTWDERIYEWSLLKGSAKHCIAVGAACSFLLLAVAITMIIYRDDITIKVFHYLHLCALLLACAVVVWGLVFVWQADVTQKQCDALLWVIYLPASFAIQLINMKAYRLSIFLTSDDTKKKKYFTHNRVFILTLYWVSSTFIVLLICQFVDPPTQTKIVVDSYRPALDYHVCRFGEVTHGLLMFLVVGHMLMSACCVIYVRNGMEHFKDGTIIKEAFIILFTLIIVAFIFGNLGISPDNFYFLRTIFIALGFTLFAFRLLMTRCLVRWLPRPVGLFILRMHKEAQRYIPQSSVGVAASENHDRKVSSIEMMAGTDEIGKDDIAADDMAEFTAVFDDPVRYALLCEVAKKLYVIENVEFLYRLHHLQDAHADVAVEHSVSCSKGVHSAVQALFEEYCAVGSEKEVNISDHVRQRLRTAIETFPKDSPFLSKKTALETVKEDNIKINDIFASARKEIAIMLYQNIWNKFQTYETDTAMV